VALVIRPGAVYLRRSWWRFKLPIRKLLGYSCFFNAKKKKQVDDARDEFDAVYLGCDVFISFFDHRSVLPFPLGGDVRTNRSFFRFLSMMVLSGVLTIASIYEWQKGALEWIVCRP